MVPVFAPLILPNSWYSGSRLTLLRAVSLHYSPAATLFNYYIHIGTCLAFCPTIIINLRTEFFNSFCVTALVISRKIDLLSSSSAAFFRLFRLHPIQRQFITLNYLAVLIDGYGLSPYLPGVPPFQAIQFPNLSLICPVSQRLFVGTYCPHLLHNLFDCVRLRFSISHWLRSVNQRENVFCGWLFRFEYLKRYSQRWTIFVLCAVVGTFKPTTTI